MILTHNSHELGAIMFASRFGGAAELKINPAGPCQAGGVFFQNGYMTPSQNCTGAFASIVLATSMRKQVRSTKPNQAQSRRRPPPTAWATPPTERPLT